MTRARLRRAAAFAAAAAAVGCIGVWGLPLASDAPAAGRFALGAALGAALWMLARRGPQRPSDHLSGPKTPAAAASSGAVFESLPTALLRIGPTGTLDRANPAADRLLDRLEVGAHFSASLRHPGLSTAITEALDQGISSEIEILTGGAQEQVLHVRLAPIQSGGRSGALVLLEDRTRQRRVEQMRVDFVANASHELRTPLASLSAYIETLRGPARGDSETSDRFLGVMQGQVKRMTQLIGDLLSLSRIEMTEHVRPMELCDVRSAVAAAAADLQTAAAEAGAVFDIQLTAPVLVSGSEDELRQVFVNLLDNAIKYGGEAPIRVVARESRLRPGMIGLQVIDRGPGVARTHVQRLTERFYRVSDAASRAKGGTGLGLAIVKHIVNRHRGTLDIESKVGEGSVFTVWLPKQIEARGGAPDSP